jgi:hypothetical protein
MAPPKLSAALSKKSHPSIRGTAANPDAAVVGSTLAERATAHERRATVDPQTAAGDGSNHCRFEYAGLDQRLSHG